ncbi:MAG: chemotaxis protein CheV [Campylobacterales bacterium]|nr:chemotaxis protein CheV [Campylobacterales bacterium]
MSQINERSTLALNNKVEILCFRLNNDTIFSINVFKIREVVKSKALTKLPYENSILKGLLTIRGETIPVLNISSWLLKYLNDIDELDGQIVICEFNDIILGIHVNRVDYILRRDWSEVYSSSFSDFGNKITSYTKSDNGDIVYIIDVEQMMYDMFPNLAISENNTKTIKHVKINLHDKLLLLAEDSNIARKAICNVLDKCNLHYKAFENGKKLLEFIAKTDISKIAAIITDLEMPEVSGFTVIKEIKEDSSTKHIPIIVYSSLTGDSNKSIIKDLKALAFVSKTNPTEVIDILQTIV